jgi:hypothetical protein
MLYDQKNKDMDDQLDNDLKKRIREVFDNFEDPSADEGWLQLREKFPEEQKNRRPLLWIWWGAAAILFLFLGIGVWMYNKTDINKYSVKTFKHTHSEKLTITKHQNSPVAKAALFNTGNRSETTTGNVAATHSNFHKTSTGLKNNIPGKMPSPFILNDTTAKKTLIAQKTDSVKKVINPSPARQFAKTDQPNKSVDNPPVNSAAINPKPKTKSIADMFAQDHGVNDKKSEDAAKMVHFGVYAATYFNYAKGSGNNANVGAGFTADVRITKNLKLVTGVTIAQNSLNFTNGVPTGTAQDNLAVFAAPGANFSAAASAYTLNSEVTVASEPAFKNYDASLVGLDIPLNLKYDFNLRKNDIYVLAGFSSGTFINETYTYQYNYPALLSPSLQQIQNETTSRSFNGFYLAKTLNFAFGFGYPLGKNSVTLEPFLKYPLEGLGSQNIRFGAGGINLKFNFLSQK